MAAMADVKADARMTIALVCHRLEIAKRFIVEKVNWLGMSRNRGGLHRRWQMEWNKIPLQPKRFGIHAECQPH